MTSDLREYEAKRFDLIVVGGGITGACLAYDAARRGLRVALLEKNDFGGATSSASSKLLHGGIRYLVKGRLDKVRESAYERVYFQNLVPHLCRYVPFLIPAYRDFRRGRSALRIASMLYTAVCAGQNRQVRVQEHGVPETRLIDADELYGLVPWLKDDQAVNGGLLLPECHMDSSERVTLAFIKGAVRYGATALNYVKVEGITRQNSQVTGVVARNRRDDELVGLHARVIANCAGPWIRSLNEEILGESSIPITSFSRGAHALVRGLSLPCALALTTGHKLEGLADRGGRHMFLIPWRSHTLVGTSYAGHSTDIDKVEPTVADMQQLIEGINTAAGRQLITEEDIVYAFAGIYPLTTAKVDADVYQGTGDYRIVDHGRTHGINGYLSIFGAKYTTARRLAEKGADIVAELCGGGFDRCRTRYEPVPAARMRSISSYAEDLFREFGDVVTREAIAHLIGNYGTDTTDVLRLVRERPALGQVICDGREAVRAEAVYAAREEMVLRLEDFVFRRTGLGTLGHPGVSALEICADLLGDELGWSQATRRQEVNFTHALFPAFCNVTRSETELMYDV